MVFQLFKLKTITYFTLISELAGRILGNPYPSSQPEYQWMNISSEDTLNFTKYPDDKVSTNSELNYFTFWDKPTYHYHLVETDFECQTYSNIFYPYTGYRITRKYIFGVPLRVSYEKNFCYWGKKVSSSNRMRLSQFAFDWKEEFCMNDRKSYYPNPNGCFRFARRANYIDFPVPMYPREAFVGGLFKCPLLGDCNDNMQVTPVAPLIADEPYMGFFEFRKPWEYIYQEPLFYTPDYYSYMYPRDDDEWARYIDINEEYQKAKVETSSNANNLLKAKNEQNEDEAQEKVNKVLGILQPYLPSTLYLSAVQVLKVFKLNTSSESTAHAISKLNRILSSINNNHLASKLYHEIVITLNGCEVIADALGHSELEAYENAQIIKDDDDGLFQQLPFDKKPSFHHDHSEKRSMTRNISISNEGISDFYSTANRNQTPKDKRIQKKKTELKLNEVLKSVDMKMINSWGSRYQEIIEGIPEKRRKYYYSIYSHTLQQISIWKGQYLKEAMKEPKVRTASDALLFYPSKICDNEVLTSFENVIVAGSVVGYIIRKSTSLARLQQSINKNDSIGYTKEFTAQDEEDIHQMLSVVLAAMAGSIVGSLTDVFNEVTSLDYIGQDFKGMGNCVGASASISFAARRNSDKKKTASAVANIYFFQPLAEVPSSLRYNIRGMREVWVDTNIKLSTKFPGVRASAYRSLDFSKYTSALFRYSTTQKSGIYNWEPSSTFEGDFVPNSVILGEVHNTKTYISKYSTFFEYKWRYLDETKGSKTRTSYLKLSPYKSNRNNEDKSIFLYPLVVVLPSNIDLLEVRAVEFGSGTQSHIDTVSFKGDVTVGDYIKSPKSLKYNEETFTAWELEWGFDTISNNKTKQIESFVQFYDLND